MTPQGAYDLGYDNPSKPVREAIKENPRDGTIHPWSLAVVNAYCAGQADAQNHCPRSHSYDPRQYDPDTFERVKP